MRLLPHVEQKLPRNNSGKTKGSERGVIAIIKPGEGQLPYIEQKSPRNNSGKTEGSERGVTFGGMPGGQSPLNFRMPGGSMSGIGSIGAHGFRAR